MLTSLTLPILLLIFLLAAAFVWVAGVHLSNNIGVVGGNILGGIAIQTAWAWTRL